MARERAEALLVGRASTFLVHRARLAELAVKGRLPTMYSYRESVEAGGLMAYAVNMTDFVGRAAVYVDKILKGAKPADLPVEQPTKFELIINLKTAKALGHHGPASVAAARGRGDSVIVLQKDNPERRAELARRNLWRVKSISSLRRRWPPAVPRDRRPARSRL